MKIFMLDNYDSFTYNLVQYFPDPRLRRNGSTMRLHNGRCRFSPFAPTRLSSPRSGASRKRGNSARAHPRGTRTPNADARRLPRTPGHRRSARGDVIHAQKVMHGKTSRIRHDGQGLFAGLPEDLSVVRYHSLAVDRTTLPADLMVTAETDDGEIMGLRHRTLPVEGIQYHPESMLTERGLDQLENFLENCCGSSEVGCTSSNRGCGQQSKEASSNPVGNWTGSCCSIFVQLSAAVARERKDDVIDTPHGRRIVDREPSGTDFHYAAAAGHGSDERIGSAYRRIRRRNKRDAIAGIHVSHHQAARGRAQSRFGRKTQNAFHHVRIARFTAPPDR